MTSGVGSKETVWGIGEAAKACGLPPWLLRELDDRGIVVPKRTDGNQRLYSQWDMARLTQVQYLVRERGVNLAGVQVILEMSPWRGTTDATENEMLYPQADKLNEFPSRYVLVLLAAKRAKQLKEGATPLVKTNSTHPLTIALEEIAQGKIRPRVVETVVEVETVLPELPSLELTEAPPAEAVADLTTIVGEEPEAEPPVAEAKPTLSALLSDAEADAETATDDASVEENLSAALTMLNELGQEDQEAREDEEISLSEQPSENGEPVG